MGFDLDPFDVANFSVQRRKATRGYGAGKAQIGYQGQVLKQNFRQNARDLRTKAGRQTDSIAGGFNQRGLLNSGIYKRAFAQMRADQTNARSKLALQYQQGQGGLNLQSRLLSTDYVGTLGDIDQLKLARRAQIASSLQGF